MSTRIESDVYIDCDADSVWAVVADPTSITAWMPFVGRCEVDGTQRIVTQENGAELVEHFTVRNSDRVFEYQIQQAPFVVTEHRGQIFVVPEVSGTRVRYVTDIAPDSLADSIEQATHSALEGLRAHLESE